MTEQIVKAIKSTPAPASPFSNINWAPLIQGITNVVVTSLGGSVNYPSALHPQYNLVKSRVHQPT